MLTCHLLLHPVHQHHFSWRSGHRSPSPLFFLSRHTLFEPHTTKKKKRRVYLFVIVFTPDIVDGCEPHLHSASSRTLTSYIYTLGFLIVLTTSWIASNGVALGVRREREMDESLNFSLCPSPAKPDERERDNSA